ncbi:MAG: rubrerythrin family protein [Bacteroidetes bacterium CG02_land_8_20_14_3_00_31_25]|nr:MAG: rubrerythrin family protein [Bacteroidetes bacterium CG02_land_8_20_14_3_00_31_25]
MTLKGTQTEKNLLKAFAGESQARNRYDFFSKVAKKEGYEQISAIFLQTSAQEMAHAKRFFRFLEGGSTEIVATYPAGIIGTTTQNLKAAAEGENEEWTKLYPEFSKIAFNEGFKDVSSAFKVISTVEAEHEKRFRKLLENIETGKVFERNEKVKWVCRVCGYVHYGTKPLENCPSCLHPKSYFELLAENY